MNPELKTHIEREIKEVELWMLNPGVPSNVVMFMAGRVKMLRKLLTNGRKSPHKAL
jgi:hypothetical protein